MDGTHVSSLPGYRILEQIHESVHSLAFRACRLEDQQPVVIKILKEEHPPLAEVVRYRREYELGSRFNGCPGVTRVLALRELDHRLALVLEDFGAESLKQLLSKRRFSLIEGLSVGVEIVRALGLLHARGVIHKDLTPANVLFNPATGEVKITDFGLSTQLSHEDPGFGAPGLLEGTLTYIAPEQTGRVSHPVDFRADFYTLGATLYHLLTGRPPFEATDPLELVHRHIAELPIAPHVLDPQIPPVVSRIVQKLLAKSPERRYQSASGIQADLERCLSRAPAGPIADFPLAAEDFNPRLVIPEQLFGRDAEIARLGQAFERVSGGAGELLLVSGYSGVGKTALVRTLFPPITNRAGYFVSGKFDQFQRNLPYKAFLDAFEQLLRYLLSEPRERLQAWKEKLQRALGPNAAVLAVLIPGLTRVLGPQPPAAALPPMESQNRFNLALQQFLGAFASPARPLVLFIDDLQWADAASLKLIELVTAGQPNPGLLLLGAYRENEVGPGHPLRLILEHLRGHCPVTEIQLAPLGLGDVVEIACASLHRPPPEIAALADLLHQKTEGNPYFLKEYLHALVKSGLVSADLEARRWKWDLTGIQSQRVTDNVADLIVSRIRLYGDDTQRALLCSAFLGQKFGLEALAVALAQEEHPALAALRPAVADGLLIPICQSYSDLEYLHGARELPRSIEFKFAHDRIHQAAYSLVEEAGREALHLQIGTRLLERYPEDGGGDEHLLDVVNHLHACRASLGAAERVRLARLCLRAGRKVKGAVAFGQALEHFTWGFELLGQGRWAQEYELTLAFCEEAAEASCLVGDFAGMERFLSEVAAHAQNPLHKIRSGRTRIEGFGARNRPQEAIAAAVDLLGELGFEVPLHPSKGRLVGALLASLWAVWGKRLQALGGVGEMQDERTRAAIQVMRVVSVQAYISNPTLFAWLLLVQVKLVARHGHTEWSPSIFASYGVLLCGLMNKVDRGNAAGQLALELLDRLSLPRFRSMVLSRVNGWMRHRKEPLRDTLPGLREGYRLGVEVGDFEAAAINAHLICQHSLFLLPSLEEFLRENEGYIRATEALHNRTFWAYSKAFHQAAQNLVDEPREPHLLRGATFDEAEWVEGWKANKDHSGLTVVTFCKLWLGYLLGRTAEAAEQAVLYRQYRRSSAGMALYGRGYLFDSLILSESGAKGSRAERNKAKKAIRLNLKVLALWARHAPMNYAHTLWLARAELASLAGAEERAAFCYAQAHRLARANGFRFDEALIAERMGACFHRKGDPILARKHLTDARYLYSCWGAKAKVNQLSRKWDFLLGGG